ncbi:MAG: ATP-binding protein [Bacteroides sp.]|nr:ATP-binding protein [Bacteroides sp.]
MKWFTDRDYLDQWIAQGEHQQQDFKFEISDARKLAKTFSAFSNTRGGRLLIGVKDNGKIAGVRSEEEAYMLEAAATLYCRPAVAYTIHTVVTEGGKQVLVAQIEEQVHKPIYALDAQGKALAYVRIGDENILASPVMLRVWQQAVQPVGQLVEYTEKERLLLELLEHHSPISLSQYQREAAISRRAAEHLLAKFIRFGIIEPVFLDHRFYFKLK